MSNEREIRGAQSTQERPQSREEEANETALKQLHALIGKTVCDVLGTTKFLSLLRGTTIEAASISDEMKYTIANQLNVDDARKIKTSSVGSFSENRKNPLLSCKYAIERENSIPEEKTYFFSYRFN